ncbi:hypothetical protein DB346_23695 [Verrucomicrobia bacterium LW23]|nr:hypothetical protein DB346_23695 [Verrucomicrobia bacterium LW23]
MADSTPPPPAAPGTNALPTALQSSQSFDATPFTSAPQRSAICRVDGLREVPWKVPALEMPPIAFVAFISTIVAISLLGITFTARNLMTPWGRKCFLVSSGVAAVVSITSVSFAIWELRAHPPQVPLHQSPVRILADVRVVAVGGTTSEFYANDKVSLDLTPYPGRFQSPRLKSGDYVRVWSSSMNRYGIFLPEYLVQVPESEVSAPGMIAPFPPKKEE